MILTARHIEVLERFRPTVRADGSEMRSPHILVRPEDDQIGRELAEAGLLIRRRQRRKGFPELSEITDAGVAALPVDAPPRPRLPDVIPSHTSPPRG